MKKPSPFVVIKSMMGTGGPEFSEITMHALRENFFMINRTLAIKFPQDVERLNSSRLSPEHVCKLWYSLLNGNFRRTPNWIYTKTRKPERPDKLNLTTAERLDFCRTFEISMRELMLAEKLNFKKTKLLSEKWKKTKTCKI